MSNKKIWEYDKLETTEPVLFHSPAKRRATGDGYYYLPQGMWVRKHANNDTRAYVQSYMNRERMNGRVPKKLLPLMIDAEFPWRDKSEVFYLDIELLQPRGGW